MFGGVLAFVSLGAAPLWLLLGGPTLLATVLATATLLPGGPPRPQSERARRLQRTADFFEMSLFGVFLPLACACLLAVAALPLHGTAESATVVVVMLAALVGSFVLTRAVFFDRDDA